MYIVPRSRFATRTCSRTMHPPSLADVGVQGYPKYESPHFRLKSLGAMKGPHHLGSWESLPVGSSSHFFSELKTVPRPQDFCKIVQKQYKDWGTVVHNGRSRSGGYRRGVVNEEQWSLCWQLCCILTMPASSVLALLSRPLLVE